MNENIKLYAKISAKSFLKWLAMLGFGVLITIILFVIILFQHGSGVGGGHGNPIAFILNLALENPFDMILFAGAPVFVFLYFMVANKITIQGIIYQVCIHHAISFVESALRGLIERVINKQDSVKEIPGQIFFKEKLLNENKKDNASGGLNKKIINYALKRIKLDGINFNGGKSAIVDGILTKFRTYITETTKPSFMFFWILILVQVLLFILGRII